MPRDDFSQEVKDILARRVGMRCSNPNCRQPTTGPREDPTKTVNVGVAAHITAASPAGSRYDSHLSAAERRSIENAMWLCQTCAKLIDNDADRYTVDLLRQWKHKSEQAAILAIENRSYDMPDDDRPAFQDASSEVKWEGGGYWTVQEDGVKDGPFCQVCYDSSKKLCRLYSGSEPDPDYDRVTHYYLKCRVCSSVFEDHDVDP